jgi:quercetin dioxygenase-like cupin family protein
MRRPLAGLCLLGLAGCASSDGTVAVYAPPAGINQVLEGPIAAAPGHTLILGDLNMPAGAEIPRHFHHGEEYIYVLGGSATVSRAGQPDVTLGPGDSILIPPGVVHWGKPGAEGLRSISAWVKDDAKPLREAAQ